MLQAILVNRKRMKYLVILVNFLESLFCRSFQRFPTISGTSTYSLTYVDELNEYCL